MNLWILLISCLFVVVATEDKKDLPNEGKEPVKTKPVEGDVCNMKRIPEPSEDPSVYFYCKVPTEDVKHWKWPQIGIWFTKTCNPGTIFSVIHQTCRSEVSVRRHQRRSCATWPQSCGMQVEVNCGGQACPQPFVPQPVPIVQPVQPYVPPPQPYVPPQPAPCQPPQVCQPAPYVPPPAPYVPPPQPYVPPPQPYIPPPQPCQPPQVCQPEPYVPPPAPYVPPPAPYVPPPQPYVPPQPVDDQTLRPGHPIRCQGPSLRPCPGSAPCRSVGLRPKRGAPRTMQPVPAMPWVFHLPTEPLLSTGHV